MWCAHCLILCLQVAGLTAAATTKNINANLDLEKVFRTPRDYSKVNFDHFEILERNNFAEDVTTPAKEEAKETVKDCIDGDDKTEQKTKCTANANAKITVRFGEGDHHRFADNKQYFYGPPPPPATLTGMLPLPTITAMHEGYFYPYIPPPPRVGHPMFYPGYPDVQEQPVRYKRGRNYDEHFHSRYMSPDLDQHVAKKRKTSANIELSTTPQADISNLKDSSSSINVKVPHIGDKAATIPNAILFTSTSKDGESDTTGIPGDIVHAMYPSQDDEGVTEPTKNPQPQSSAIQIAPDDTFFKGHPKILTTWMLKNKGISNEKLEEVVNATDSIYNEALKKIGAILLHLQAGGEKECRKDDLDIWLNASLVPYRCKGCDYERKLLVSYPINGERNDVECVCSEDSNICSCKPCSCGECSRDPSVPFGKRFRADEDMLHKITEQINLNELPSIDTLKHPKAKAVLHTKERDSAAAIEQDLDRTHNEIVGEVLTRRHAKRRPADGNKKDVYEVDGQKETEQLEKRLVKREIDVTVEENWKRDATDVAKLAATEPTPRKFVAGSDQINQSDAPQLDKHLAKREGIPFGKVDPKRDEVEVAKLAATEPTPRKFVPGSDQINQSDAPQLDKHLAKREGIPFGKADPKRDEVEVAKLAATEPTPKKFVPGSDKINQSDAPQLDKHLAKREGIPFGKPDPKRDEVEVAKLAATEPTPRKFVPGSDQINQSDAPQLDKHLAKREAIPFGKAGPKRDEVEVAKLAATEPTPKKFVPGSDQINQSDAPQLDKHLAKREGIPFGKPDPKRDEVEVAKLAATEPTPRKFVPGSDQINQSDAPQLDKHLAKREAIPFGKAGPKRDEVEVAKLAATEPTPRKFVPGSDQINQSDAPQLDKHLAKREGIPFGKADPKRDEVEVAKLAATEPTPKKFVPGSDKINQSDAPQLDKHLAKRGGITFGKADPKRDEVEVAKLAATEPTPRKFVPGSDQINQSDAPQLDKHLAKREGIPFGKADPKRDEVEVAKLAATEPTPRKFVKGSDQINQSDAPQLDKHLTKREGIPFGKPDPKRDEVEVAKLAATEPTPKKFVPGSDKINQSDAPQLDKHLAKREGIPFGKADPKRDEVEVAKLAATEPTPKKFVPGSDQINQSDAPQLDKHLAKREGIPFGKPDPKRDEVEVAKLAATEPTPRKFVPGSDQINQSDAPQLDKHLAKREGIPFGKADPKRDEVEVAKLAATEPTPKKFVPGSDKINQSDAPQLDKHLAKREGIPFGKPDPKRDEVEVAKLAATEPTPRKFVPGSDQINQSDAPQLDKHLAKREGIPFGKADPKRDEVEVAKLAATEPTPKKFVPGSDKINQSDAPQLDKHLAKREGIPFGKADPKRDEVEVAKLAATEPTPRKFVPGSDQINQSDAPQLDKHLAKREGIPFGKPDPKRDEVEVAKLAATEPTPRKFVPGSDQINQSDAPQLDKHLAKREGIPFGKADPKRDEVEVAKLAATEPTPRKFVPGSDQINQSDAPQLDKHLAKREGIPFGKADPKRDEVEVAKLAATEPTPRKFVPGSDQINQSDAPQLDKHLAKREGIPFGKADPKRDEVEVAKLAATEPTPKKFVPGSDKINQSDAPQLDKHLAKREGIPFGKADPKRDEVEVAKLAATEPTPRKFVPGSDQINQSDAPQLDKHLAKREGIPFGKADPKRDEVEVAKLAATEPTPRKFVPGSDQINQSDAPQLDKHLSKREGIPFGKADPKRDEVEVAKLAATEPTPKKFVPGSDQINQSDAPQLDKHLAKREGIPFGKPDPKRDEVEVAKLAATEPTPKKFVPGSDKINQSDAPQLDKHLAKREGIPFGKADPKRDEVEVAKLAATEPTPRKFVPGSDQINQSDAPQLDKHLSKREGIPFGKADPKRDEVEVAKLAATEPTPRKFVPGSDQINQSDAPQLDKHLAKREGIPFGKADPKRDEVEVAKLAATEPTPRKFVPGSDQINQSDAPQLDKHLAKREGIPFGKADPKRDEVEVAKLAATEPTPRKFVPGSDKINQSDAPQLDKHLAKREGIPFGKADPKRDEVEVAKLAATEPTPKKFVPGSDKINQSDAPQLDKHLAKREGIPFGKADPKRDEVEVAKLAATEPTPRKFVPGSDQINQSDAPQLDKHLAKRGGITFGKADPKRDEVEVAKLAATEPTPRKFVPGSDQINQSDAPQLDKHLAKREGIPFGKADPKRDEVEVAKLAATEPTPRKFVPGSDQINQSDAPQLDKHLAKRGGIPFGKADPKRDEVEVAKLAATEPTPRKFVPGSDQINQSDAPQLDKHLAKREGIPFGKADPKRDEVEVAKLAATEPTPRKFVKGSDQINQSDAPQLDKHLTKREGIPFGKADPRRDDAEVAKLAATHLN